MNGIIVISKAMIDSIIANILITFLAVDKA